MLRNQEYWENSEVLIIEELTEVKKKTENYEKEIIERVKDIVSLETSLTSSKKEKFILQKDIEIAQVIFFNYNPQTKKNFQKFIIDH
jgi:hypothetical protein